MKTLTRNRPTRDIGWSLFDDGFDNMFEGFFRPLAAEKSLQEGFSPAVDLTENKDKYMVKADLPGVKKDDISVTLQDGVLTISAETKDESEEKEGDIIVRKERRYGKYTRSMYLNQQVDEKHIKAHYADGVLELEMPKKEESKPNKIAINVH